MMLRLSIFMAAMIGITFLFSYSTESFEDSRPLDILQDTWVAEPSRMTKDSKLLEGFSSMRLHLVPEESHIFMYSHPSTELMPTASALTLLSSNVPSKGSMFRFLRHTDSTKMVIGVSNSGDRLTLAFAIEEGPTTGEYVLSFRRQKDHF